MHQSNRAAEIMEERGCPPPGWGRGVGVIILSRGSSLAFKAGNRPVLPVEPDEPAVVIKLEFEPSMNAVWSHMLLQSGSREDYGLTVDGGCVHRAGGAAIIIEKASGWYVELEDQRGHKLRED
jgi:hypothetical protein